MPTSVRLDAKTDSLIRRLAKKRGQSKSEVIRQALAAYSRQEAQEAKRPFDAIAHLIGCADSKGAALSVKTGEKFRALIRERAGARRSD